MPIVNVYLKGGVIQGVAIPTGSNVIVRVVDYDCEGGECLDIDDEGTPCMVALYETPNKGKEAP